MLKDFPLATKENSFTKAFFFRVLKKISLYESNEGFFFNPSLDQP
jgi:hypothetical protein